MGFLGSILSAGVKIVLTPVAVVKDVVDVAHGESNNTTGKLLESALEDVKDGLNKIV